MGALVEMLIGVDPREEAGDVVQFGEGDDCLLELDLAAGDEFAFEDSVVDLLVQGALGLGQGCGRLVSFEDDVEVSQQLAVQVVDRVANVVVALVDSH